MSTLYEIDSRLKSIFSQIEENDGEITEELEQELEAVEMDREQKLNAYCHVYQNLTSEAEKLRAEQARINAYWQERIDKQEKQIAGLLKHLDLYIQDGEKFKSEIGLTIERKTSKASKIFDADIIPEEWWKEKTTVTKSIDKAGILRKLKLGENIPGAKLDIRKNIKIS